MAATATRLVCAWCGRALSQPAGVGRQRRYCMQSCRQRAYEQRRQVHQRGLPPDAVVLSANEAAGLADRLFRLRCAAEDLVTAVFEGAELGDLERLGRELADAARDLERLRSA